MGQPQMLRRIREAWEKEVVERFREGLKSLDIILWVAIAVNAIILLTAFWNQIVATIGIGGTYFLLGSGVALFFFLLFTGEEIYLVDELFGDVHDPVKQHLGFLPFWRKPYKVDGRDAIKVGVFPKHEVVLQWGKWEPPYVVRSFILTKIYGKIERVEKSGFWSKRIYMAPLFPKEIVVPKIKKRSLGNPDGEELEIVEGYEKKPFNPQILVENINLVNSVSSAYEETLSKIRGEIKNLRKEIASKDKILAELSSAIRESGIRSSSEFIRHTKDGFEIASEIIGLSSDALIDMMREMRKLLKELREMREEIRGRLGEWEEEKHGKRKE